VGLRKRVRENSLTMVVGGMKEWLIGPEMTTVSAVDHAKPGKGGAERLRSRRGEVPGRDSEKLTVLNIVRNLLY